MAAPSEHPANEILSKSVRDALWRSEPIRAVDLDSLQVEALDGIVVLRGVVASEAHRVAAIRLARGVAGVKDVVNELVTDEELERRIGLALASDPSTRGRRITVNVRGGIAGLYGAVPSEDDIETVRRVARAVPGVIGVESRMQVVSQPRATP